jgi:hypothetical protein
MPLPPGKKNIGRNITELSQTGRPRAQVLAIALKTAGVPKAKPRPKASGMTLRERCKGCAKGAGK